MNRNPSEWLKDKLSSYFRPLLLDLLAEYRWPSLISTYWLCFHGCAQKELMFFSLVIQLTSIECLFCADTVPDTSLSLSINITY